MRATLLASLLATIACSSPSTEPVTVVPEDAGEDTSTEAIDEGVDTEPADTRVASDTKPVVDTAVPDTAPPTPCSDLALPPAIDGDRWGDKEPAAVGGTLPAESVWHLFSARQYGTTSGPLGAFRGAFRVKAGKYDLRLVTPSGAIESSGTYSTAGTVMQLVPTCTIGKFPTTLGYDVGLNYVRLHASPTVYAFSYPK